MFLTKHQYSSDIKTFEHDNIICRQNGKSQHNNELQTSAGSKIRKSKLP